MKWGVSLQNPCMRAVNQKCSYNLKPRRQTNQIGVDSVTLSIKKIRMQRITTIAMTLAALDVRGCAPSSPSLGNINV